jgi:hypothetical protein
MIIRCTLFMALFELTKIHQFPELDYYPKLAFLTPPTFGHPLSEGDKNASFGYYRSVFLCPTFVAIYYV